MNKKEWGYIFRVIKELDRRYHRMAVLVGLSVLQGVNPFITIILMGKLLDAVKAGAGADRLIFYALLAIGANRLLGVLIGRMRESFNQKNEYVQDIESAAFVHKSLLMDYEYLEDMEVQSVRQNSNQKSGGLGIGGSALYHLEPVITGIVSIFLAFCIMLPMLRRSTSSGTSFFNEIISVIGLLLLFLVLLVLEYRLGVYHTARAKEEDDRVVHDFAKWNYYVDMLAQVESQKDARIYAQQEILDSDTRGILQRMVGAWRRSARHYVRNQWVVQTQSALFLLLVYAFVGYRAYLGLISIGEVVTLASAILQATEWAAQLISRLVYLKRDALYCKQYCEFMDLDKRKYEGTIPLEKRRDNRFQVEFEHVSFRYPGTETDVIKDLNLAFTIGERMAIVGKNGSGKTTFIKLLCRLYDVTEGCIKVNGIDIRKYDYQEYCNLFAVVFQDFRIFDFPVGENIASSENVDEGRAMDALSRAGLGECMARLPLGLGTYVGKEFEEGGVSFSGGERQKMAIARAIYKDAPFVIMDEPTAALDPVSECDVYAGFDRMVGNKTALYISHRLASCRFCEDILVFDKGRVVQRGSHEKLEKEEGLYRELWNAQAQYYA